MREKPAHPSTARAPIHLGVAHARAIAWGGGLYGFSLTISSGVLVGFWASQGAALVIALSAWLLQRRLLKRSQPTNSSIASWAMAPAYAAAVAFLLYGITFNIVHLRYSHIRIDAYAHRSQVEVQRVKRHNAPIEAQLHKASANLVLVTKRLREREVRLRTLTIQFRHAQARRAKVALKTTALAMAKTEKVEAKRTLVTIGREKSIERQLVLLNFPGAPSVRDIPAWFGRLGSFFTVATQILAALVIALAFTRRRTSIAGQALQAAMPVALMGVAFGVAGNLPSLPPSIQGILLGPVVAGLAGTLVGLAVIALGLPDDIPEPYISVRRSRGRAKPRRRHF